MRNLWSEQPHAAGEVTVMPFIETPGISFAQLAEEISFCWTSKRSQNGLAVAEYILTREHIC